MKSYKVFAWKELKTQKVTSFLILIAMVLSTLMTTVIGQSVGVLNAMRVQQAASLMGKQYASFLQVTEEQVKSMKEDSRFQTVGEYMGLGSVKLNPSISMLLIEPAQEYLDLSPSLTKIKEGRIPRNSNELALPEDALKYLDFQGKIGDTITLDMRIALRQGTEAAFEYGAEFLLTGILESNYLGYSSGKIVGIAGAGTGMEVLPEKYRCHNAAFQTKNQHDFQDIVDEYTERFEIPDINITYNHLYLGALGVPYRSPSESDTSSGFSFMILAGVLIGALVLLAAGLVIYNILKISVSQRVQEYGTLRAVGGEKKQLYTLVTVQLLILCGIGIPIGMLVGTLSTKGIITMAASTLSPSAFMVRTSSELRNLIAANSTGNVKMLALSGGITLLFAFLAAMPAAKYAARVPPTLAMSGPAVKVKRRNRKSRKIRSFEAFYARLNLCRNKGRTAITILSLVMSITVFIALQSFTALLNAASDMEKSYYGDYALTSENAGFSPRVLQKLEEYPEVQSVSAVSLQCYYPDKNGGISADEIKLGFTLQPGETFQVAGLNDDYLNRYFEKRLSRQQIEELKNGTGCVVRNPLPISFEGQSLAATNFQAGDRISIAGKEWKVIDTMDGYEGYIGIGNGGFTNGVQVIAADTVYSEMTGKNTIHEMYPTLCQGADREAFDRFIENICAEEPDSSYISYENADKQMEESFEQTKMLAWGLIIFVSLIGILNIINTVYTNIHTRVTEIGVQRAVGMSVGSLYKTFLWEGAYYGLIASVIGSAAGYICTIFVQAARTDSIGLVPVPVLPIAEAALISVAACLLASCIPLRKISKMAIVRAIENVE